MKIITILTAAALGLTATASIAEPVSTTVSFADLDMSSPAGKAALAHRIAHAATMVCDATRFPTDLVSYSAGRSCRGRAIKAAMQAVALKTAPRYASR